MIYKWNKFNFDAKICLRILLDANIPTALLLLNLWEQDKGGSSSFRTSDGCMYIQISITNQNQF